ncbi:hypothetical protein FQN54_006120 [Arachnomyces sp. PD_36]|nr:hypothetical protein FQN54_006120 [Arachnomyces sp. PD_36]
MDTAAVHLPVEVRHQILQYLYEEEDLTVWQKCDVLRNTRLTSHAWCQSANELLFDHITITAERCLGFEVERILKLDELCGTGLAGFVKRLGVYVSPNYYRYVDVGSGDGEGGGSKDVVQCMARYLPGCISRLQRLEVLEVSLPRGECWAYWDDVSWDLPVDCKHSCYATIHRSLSASHLPRLRGLGLDLFDICDLETIIDPFCCDAHRNVKEGEKGNPIFNRNISQIRHLSLTLKSLPRLDDCHRSCYKYNRVTSYSRATTKPVPLLKLWRLGIRSLETLSIDVEVDEINLDMRNYFVERLSLQNMRSIEMNRALLSYEDIMHILDTNHHTLEKVTLTWGVDLPSKEPRRAMKKKLEQIRETLKSMPRLEEAQIRSPAGHIEIPDGFLSEWGRRSWLNDGEYYFPYRDLDDLYEF